MKDAQSAIDHLRRLSRLTDALALRGIALYHHDYVMLAFGSFGLELGTRHWRWAISWDGKEGFLTVSERYAPVSVIPPPTDRGTAVRLDLGDPDAVFAHIERLEFRLD